MTAAIRAFLASQDGTPILLSAVIHALVSRFGLTAEDAGRAIADYAAERSIQHGE